jgi:hypothetical protein
MNSRLNQLLLNAQVHGTPMIGMGIAAGGSGIKYIDFVKEWHMEHPEYSWKQAMKKAKVDYHKMQGGDAYFGSNPSPRLGPVYGGKRKKSKSKSKKGGMYSVNNPSSSKRGGYGTKAGARKAVRTKRKRGELESEALKAVLTKLLKGKIKNAPSLRKGGYGTHKGAMKAVMTKLKRGEIKHSKMLGSGILKGGNKNNKRAAARSPWIQWVKDYQDRYGVSYKVALSKAGPSYRKFYGLAKKKSMKKKSMSGSKSMKKKSMKRKPKKNQKNVKFLGYGNVYDDDSELPVSYEGPHKEREYERRAQQYADAVISAQRY